MFKSILLHPIFYLVLATLSFATATLSFTPSGFFVVIGIGLLGIMVWRIFITVMEMEAAEKKNRYK